MALVSPGTEITVIDESQYVSTSVGTVPLVFMATAQDKVFNGSVAAYTTKENAGKLLAVTSQRELITNFGYPVFKQSASGTPLHGNEQNEYGLMALYSSMGVTNLAYIVRADIDLDQLEGTSVRPIGDPSNGTYWLDLSNTAWGIYEWNASTQEYTNKVPLVITSTDNVQNIGGILTPVVSVGSVGSYAVVACSPNNYLFYKRSDNVWVQVGSVEWQKAYPTVFGTVTDPIIVPNSTLTINTVGVTLTGSTVALAASSINSAAIPGVTAGVSAGKLVLYVTNEAMGNGSTADGKIVLLDGVSSPLAIMGITAGEYASPAVSYGSYVQVPDWRSTDDEPRPSGSIWAKTSSLGGGASLAVKQYKSDTDVWSALAAPIYSTEAEALYTLDAAAGGNGIEAGTIYVRGDVLGNGTITYRPFYRQSQGQTKISGTAPTSNPVFTVGNAFRIRATQIGSEDLLSSVITLTGNDSVSFVSAVLSAAIPGVEAQIEASGAITFLHKFGGTIYLSNVTGTPLTTAGFTTATTGVQVEASTGELRLSNFTPLVYTYSLTEPYTAPEDGTLWYNGSPLDVDILINETTGWKGYRNVSRDARGYNLVNTDPNGPIMAPIAPTTQSDETPLVPGDLWIDTDDLENFPVMYRWTGTQWKLIDNADHVTQNGVIFADARWDASGTLDPVAGDYEDISTLLTSDYIDLDCPDHRLFPRGTLLFNMRRSGFNVKRYVVNYFNDEAYPDAPALPTEKSTWVTASGLKDDGSPYMGSKAQRIMVVEALRAAVDANEQIREEAYFYNLIVTPGYPELIPNMVQLNNDRKNTAFIIGDTPMTMPAKVMDITEWSTGAVAGGLTTADPYYGVFYPSGLTNDLEGNTIAVPPSHMVLRTAIRSDNVSYQWFAFAGTRRGLIDNATDLGYVNAQTGGFVRNGLNQGMRDALYQLNINPITLLPNVGMTNFGNKTRQGTASAMDRINVARLVNYIRTILAHVGDAYLFEPNDAITRNQIKVVIESALNDLVTKRGIYDYLVVCDESNNDSGRIARNELYVDIAIEPMKTVEFIYIPIRLKNPGDIKGGGK